MRRESSLRKKTYKASLLFILIFFSYTLVNKATDLPSFKLNIAKTGLFPMQYVDILAYFALGIELICILLLICKEKIGLLFSLIMMLVFTSYILLLYILGRYEECGCGGILNSLPFGFHLSINLLIIVVLLVLNLSTHHEK